MASWRARSKGAQRDTRSIHGKWQYLRCRSSDGDAPCRISTVREVDRSCGSETTAEQSLNGSRCGWRSYGIIGSRRAGCAVAVARLCGFMLVRGFDFASSREHRLRSAHMPLLSHFLRCCRLSRFFGLASFGKLIA